MRRSPGVTLSDVAREAGVSKVTVSCILSDRPAGTVRVSEGTRQRVLAAARELGYRPNALARGLARRRTDTITLVMQFPGVFSGGSGFISEMMYGVVDAANAINYDLMLHTKTQPDPDSDLRSLLDGRSDGALLLRDRDDPILAGMAERGHPFVQIFSRADRVPGACFVDVDNVEGGRLAARHLLDLGHRRIAFLGGSPRSAAVIDREAGYRAALADAGLPSPPPGWAALRMNYAGDEAGIAALVALFRTSPPGERPTALFAWSDDVALRAMNVLRQECGLRVPGDVSVVGFDGTEAICERSSNPRLTSVRQPIQEIAERGVALLVSCISGEPVERTQQVFEPTLVVRDSCAPPARPGA